ncbi:alpha/beta fold hydrolase [Primorskyibacter sp. S187A]|uniref:alpha/beta fold hydrolase n=1 Tax=Primorskyibacter sp. S187A TaxID=3415130 RepID=UPI003C79C5FC
MDKRSDRFERDGQVIAYDIAGDGPPVLLLHGFPQCRAMWHGILPPLVERFTCVTADLRGYGESLCAGGVSAMSFREMAADQVALMAHLGFERFHLVGHDRGGRVAHRLTLDHGAAVASLTLMDIVPTHLLLSELRHDVARAYYHWFFLAQRGGLPEHMIGLDPDTYYESCLTGWGKDGLAAFDAEALEIYRSHWRKPEVIASMCDDYRAAIDLDMGHDAEDLDRRVPCPALVLYGAEGLMAEAYDVGACWQDRLAQMQARAVPGGHFFPDTHPRETAAALLDFLPHPDRRQP